MAETIASYSVPEHHVKMYTANVRSVLQRKGGELTTRVSRGSYSGEKVQLVNFIGPVEFIERQTVYGDTKLTELEHTQRWISGREYDCAVLIDRLDTLKMIYDPTSPYVERFREAAARRQDAIIMSKFFATSMTGKDGTEAVAFPSRDIIANGGTGLTVSKLRTLRKTMKRRLVDLRSQKPMIAVTAEQIDNLLGEVTVGSSDYNSVKPLVDGEVSSFMGFWFVPYEDYNGEGIPKNGTIRQCPAWVPDGMHYGEWDGLVITINNRPDKNNIKQIHGTFTAGATRVEEGKVFQVECVEPT